MKLAIINIVYLPQKLELFEIIFLKHKHTHTQHTHIQNSCLIYWCSSFYIYSFIFFSITINGSRTVPCLSRCWTWYSLFYDIFRMCKIKSSCWCGQTAYAHTLWGMNAIVRHNAKIMRNSLIKSGCLWSGKRGNNSENISAGRNHWIWNFVKISRKSQRILKWVKYQGKSESSLISHFYATSNRSTSTNADRFFFICCWNGNGNN